MGLRRKSLCTSLDSISFGGAPEDKRYLQYIKDWIDSHIDNEGQTSLTPIRTAKRSGD